MSLIRRGWAATLCVPLGMILSMAPAAAVEDPDAPAQMPITQANDFIFLALLIGLFVIIGWVFVYVFLGWTTSRYFQSVDAATAKGITTGTRSVPGIGILRKAADSGLAIEGPNRVAVGESASFQVTGGGSADTTWSTEPGSAAAVNPTKGTKVAVTAAVAGAFTLKVSDGGVAEVQVAALPAASQKRSRLPFLGQGWVSLVLAIMLIAVVVLLAAGGILDQPTTGTLLGAIAGYVFGVTTTKAQTTGEPDPGP